MVMVSTTLDSAQDTAQALADSSAKDTVMHLTMAALEELPLVVSHRDRGHWLLARRVAVPVERPHPGPVPVLVPAGSDVLTSLWLETRCSKGSHSGCPRTELLQFTDFLR